jgi:hypothetical protein
MSAPSPANNPTPETQQMSVVDMELAFRTWMDQRVAQGKITAKQAHDFWQAHGHDYLEKFKSYFPAGKDSFEGSLTIRTIVMELGIAGRYYIKRYGDRDYIVFKGFAGARKMLTGTRYGINHHKIMELKMTRSGMRAAAREGLIFGILFSAVVDITDYVTNDRETLGELFGTFGMDVAKGLIATGAAYAVGVGAAAMMGTAVIALGPVVLAVVVGVGLSLALDAIDNHYHLTQKLGQLCDDGLARLQALEKRLEVESRQTWHNIVTSRTVRDLSREAHEFSDWVGRESALVRWKLSSGQ